MKTFRLAMFSSLMFLAPFALKAQAHTFDVAAGGGLADYFCGSGCSNSAKGLVDASLLYNFTSHFGLGVEYTYSPVATNTQNFSGYVLTNSAHLDHYGVVARIPFATRRLVEPYAAVYLGELHESTSSTLTNIVTTNSSYNGGYGGAGGGLNIFLAGGLGVRPEFRYEYLRVNSSSMNEVDLVGSIFYRFGR